MDTNSDYQVVAGIQRSARIAQEDQKTVDVHAKIEEKQTNV
jgi:hypothetical protein